MATRSRSRKTGTKKKTKGRRKKMVKIPDCCPYRPTSSYAKAFSLLYWASLPPKSGINRQELIRQYALVTGKPEKLAAYDVHVVVSPTKEGGGHSSSKKLVYWVEKRNSFCCLHMA